MRRRYMIAALVGALFGFTGQYFYDHYTWHRLFPPFVFVMGDERVDDYLRSKRHIDERDMPKARELWCESKVLAWLDYGLGRASGTAALSALVAVFVLLAEDRRREDEQLQKEKAI